MGSNCGEKRRLRGGTADKLTLAMLADRVMPIRQLRVKKELDWKGGRVREVLQTIDRDRAGEGAAIPPSISVTPLQELRRTDSTPKK